MHLYYEYLSLDVETFFFQAVLITLIDGGVIARKQWDTLCGLDCDFHPLNISRFLVQLSDRKILIKTGRCNLMWLPWRNKNWGGALF